MLNNYEPCDMANDQAPWVRSSAFNNYWTYSFIGRSVYYSMIGPEYYDFMGRIVRNWLWWNDGYVPYFHNSENGIPSTRLASALVEKCSRKIAGGKILYKNAGDDSTVTEQNPALAGIGDWARDTNFDEVVKKAIKYATAAGTSLIKLNRGTNGLWCEALRFDSFIPTVGASGDVVAVDCFLRCFTNLGVRGERAEEGSSITAYYVLESRYFGDYISPDGHTENNVPLVEYVVKRSTGSITNGEYISQGTVGKVAFRDLPREMQRSIGKAYAGIWFDKPMRLPFPGSLGCELVKFSDSITGIPELPFGESLLSGIISQLMSWDYYAAASNTDMYLGRGRVLVPAYMQNKASRGDYNTGIDGFIYTKVPSANPDGQSPVPLQFDLRSQSWTEIRTRLIQDISIITGLNISTIASFISDSTAARTAREISTEENETADFVNEKRTIMEKPINKILKLVCRYLGFVDTVAIRWSGTGLTNRYALAEILNMGLSGGFLSRYKAVQMFNFDDDTQQVQEEYERIIHERKDEMQPEDFDVMTEGERDRYDNKTERQE